MAETVLAKAMSSTKVCARSAQMLNVWIAGKVRILAARARMAIMPINSQANATLAAKIMKMMVAKFAIYRIFKVRPSV